MKSTASPPCNLLFILLVPFVFLVTFLLFYVMNNNSLSIAGGQNGVSQLSELLVKLQDSSSEQIKTLLYENAQLKAENENLKKQVNDKPLSVPAPGPVVPIPAKCFKNTPITSPTFNYASCQYSSPADYHLWKYQPDICSTLTLVSRCKFNHLLGNDFKTTSQIGWGDIIMLDFAFTAHPRIKNIAELGSFKGITSLYLAALANMRGGSFSAFDIQDRRAPGTVAAWNRMGNMKYNIADLLRTPIQQNILDGLAVPDTLYFFDNGKKIYEVNTYLKYIAVNNSPFCTHDWDNEISLHHIQAELQRNDYVEFAKEHAEVLGSHVRCFHKRGTLEAQAAAAPR
jgi:hypothetical protein